MAKITFVEHDGTEHVLEGENGMTVMELAIKKLSAPALMRLRWCLRMRDLSCLCS